jgi:hypothetical protein
VNANISLNFFKGSKTMKWSRMMRSGGLSKKLLVLLAAAAVSVSLVAVWSVSAEENPSMNDVRGQILSNHSRTPYVWTGYNKALGSYFVYWGYPSYAAHPRFLGSLTGSWRQIGEQYGRGAGDLIRLTFEGWFMEKVQTQGSTQAVLDYIHQVEDYYKTLVPEALEFMDGMATGAKTELDKSPLADVMTHYEKILMINSYFGLGVPPPAPSQGPSTLSPLAISSEDAIQREEGCSGAVILGKGTADGKAIHVSSEDQHFFPQEYLVTYVVHPSDPNAHTYTVTDTAGEIGSQTAINDKGVVVSGYAGGGVGIGPRRAGLDWQVGVWYATAFSDTAQKAVELLTVGRPDYRAKSGRKIVIGKCGTGVNWVASDRSKAFVVESIPADLNGVARYAIRVPGDMGETGDYIASTNNVEAKDSYNENNVYDPTHPMSQHGSAFTSPVYGLGVNGGSGTRWMTYMSLIKQNYGHITREMVQDWRTAHYVYDVNGARHDTLSVPDVGDVSAHLAVGTLCAHTRSGIGKEGWKGSNTYVSIAIPEDLAVYRTVGRPCEWVGPWDALSLNSIP